MTLDCFLVLPLGLHEEHFFILIYILEEFVKLDIIFQEKLKEKLYH